MSEDNAVPDTRLWTEAGFRDDDWVHLEDASEIGGNRGAILPLDAFLGLTPEERGAGEGRIAVQLLPGDPVEAIVPHLDGLALVALAFPAFSDGRSFSKAELLRRRHGYGGRLRATGEVLIDQIPHMLRTGFDEFEVRNPTALERLAEGRIGGLGLHYQPTAREGLAGESYSWRRLPAKES